MTDATSFVPKELVKTQHRQLSVERSGRLRHSWSDLSDWCST